MALQGLRNCGGRFGEKAKTPMIVNGSLYKSCPRSLCFDKIQEQFILGLYFDCTDKKTYPYGTSKLQNTAFLMECFDFIEEIVNTYKRKQDEKMEKDLKKQSKG